MRVKGWSLSLVVALLASAAWAVEPPSLDKAQEKQEKLSLGDLQSFDVLGFETHDFSTDRTNAAPELAEFARNAMQKDDVLRYNSPGQGVLRFSCETSRCYRVKAEVTVGPEGPVVWSMVGNYRPRISLNTLKEPEPKKFATTVVQKLGQDYRNAMKAVPLKIQIKED